MPTSITNSTQNVKATNPTMSAHSSDPWASADFSFFEAPRAPQPKYVTALVPKAIPTKSVTFGTPTSATELPRRDQRSREEIEHDRIVQNVIKSLPDLTYMLRR
jgi:hypothetical protein